jgi:hypothetical protein
MQRASGSGRRGEVVGGGEARRSDVAFGSDFVGEQRELARVALGEVPGVGRELVPHALNEAGRAVESQCCATAEQHAH